MTDKAIITCALNGVLTDPRQHHVPVTPEQMAAEAKAAYDAGAAVMHIHLRQQGAGKGHLPSWDVELSKAVQAAIRDACPGVIINHTTGVVGPDYGGALACIRADAAGDRGLQRGLAQLSQAQGRRRIGRGRRCCSTIPSPRCRIISTR